MSLIIPSTPRLLIEAELRPLQGTRFQPTGFPDIGPSTYRLPDGTEMLVVESAQSVANRLETVCWDEPQCELVEALRGTPYIRVHQDGKFLTSSILEAHRLNSVYIEKSDGWESIKGSIAPAESRGFDRARLASTLLRLDPSSLIHGVFLESISGVLRLARALSGFIEARGVGVVATGGVKNDRVSATTEEGAGAAEGYGNVPFHRDEFTAERITAFFNLDLAQLRSFGLGDAGERFLVALALWKVHRFLEEGLRLRTACDLEAIAVRVTRPEAWDLPARPALESVLRESLGQLRKEGRLAEPPVTVVNHVDGKKGKGKKAK